MGLQMKIKQNLRLLIRISIFILLIFLFFIIQHLYLIYKDKNINVNCNFLSYRNSYAKLFLNDALFDLNANGLHYGGEFFDYKKNNWIGDIYLFPKLDKKELYFFSSIMMQESKQIYKMNLTNSRIFYSITSILDGKHYFVLSISPNDRLLIYGAIVHDPILHSVYTRPEDNYKYTLWLSDLQTNKQVELVDDLDEYCQNVIWVSNTEFIYTTNKKKLILYDVSNSTKTDLHLDKFYPSGVIDEKNIILNNGRYIVKYNLVNKNIEKLVKVDNSLTSDVVIWVPQLNGLLYTRKTLYDVLHVIDTFGDLMFYSFDQKKEFVLMRVFNLIGGFVIPSNMNITPVNFNRESYYKRQIKLRCE